MKYFIVEGILKDSDKINEDIMKNIWPILKRQWMKELY